MLLFSLKKKQMIVKETMLKNLLVTLLYGKLITKIIFLKMKHVFLVTILVMIVKETVITAQFVKKVSSFLITLVLNVFMAVIVV
jgi:hypothetical protein